MAAIPHYLIDINNPDENYTVAEYKRDAVKAIKSILKKGKLPILVGGTGLYVEALVENYQFQGRNQKQRGPKKYQVLQIGVDLPRDLLYQRVDQRVDDRLKIGMLEEVLSFVEETDEFRALLWP